jgi:glucosamine kinase
VYLIVDSGSSKADWVFYNEDKTVHYQTDGINPSTQNAEFIYNQLASLAELEIEVPGKIFFYGAGTRSHSAKEILQTALSKVFKGSEIIINSDLLAAGRALCNKNPGIVCIIGTGSHAALCDGHEIVHQLPALGYILGDEGSGNDLGKKILTAFFYKKMDVELQELFLENHPEVLTDFMYSFYQSENKSAQLARFARFVVIHKQHILCKQIIMDCFHLDFF